MARGADKQVVANLAEEGVAGTPTVQAVVTC